MLKFHVQEYERCANYILPACSLAAGRHIDQTFGVLDVKGVGLRHLTGDVKRMLTRVMGVDQDNFPEMMGHTCIINAPSVFKAIWAFVRPMLDARTQAKVEVCSSKFAPNLLRWVSPENLPEYLGGVSTATLLDDSGPWQVRKRVLCFFVGRERRERRGRGEEGEGRRAKKKNSLKKNPTQTQQQQQQQQQQQLQDPALLAAVEAAEAAREGRRHKGGGRGGIAEEDEEEEEEEEGEGGTSRRRREVVEVEGEESLPAPAVKGAAVAAAAAARPPPPPPSAAISISRGPSTTAAENNIGDEDDEDEFGTPKSECSFVSAFSSVGASAAAMNGGRGAGGEGAALAPSSSSSSTSAVPLLERVHRLEAALPGHAARVRAQASTGGGGPATSRRLSAAADLAERALADGRGTLLMRVAQLEAALGALVDAETALAAGRAEKSRVACCSVM
jgi:hypothetical protein